MKSLRVNTLAAILLGALTAPTLTISAFGQQEVDPTWYDPWAKPAAVHAQQAKPVIKATAVLASRAKAKKRVRGRSEGAPVQVALATK